MIPGWLDWQRTPWGKASGNQWRYALRNAIAMCLALSIAYALDLDEPYWAMTSAAVVSFPTPGGVISKSLGRVVGSLIGASASLMIAGSTLNDPWFFSLSMAGWLALCTWTSSHFHNNAAYAAQLAGYTAAIIAFTMVNTVETTQLWDIAQARVCEVLIGIACGGFMMMVLPSTSDGSTLLVSLKTQHARLLEHASLLWQPETTDAMRTAHQGMISQILTLNILRIQAFWSHYRFRQNNNLLNAILHQQLRLTSTISGLRRLIINWHDMPPHIAALQSDLLAELARDKPDRYRIARLLALCLPEKSNDYRHLAYWQRLRYFCHTYLRVNHQRVALENDRAGIDVPAPKTASLTRHADIAEALWNALRTFCVITLGCAWTITAQWDAGSSALTMIAICCVLYSSSPSPHQSLSLLMRTLILLSLFSFAVKFGLMIRVTELWEFLLFLFPLLATMQLMKLQQPKFAGLWGQLIVFMGSFIAVTNPPVYDFGDFLNDNLAKIIGVGLAWMAFSILKPGSDTRKGRRHIRALRRGFIDQLSRKPEYSESEFESLVYHHVHQLSQAKEETARRWLLRWGVVLLNCSHVVWALRAWEARSDPLAQVRDVCISTLRNVMSERGIQKKPLGVALNELQRYAEVLARRNDPAAVELAALIWRLYCSLKQLEQAPTADNPANGAPAAIL
ncbi:FUSC family protein [Atlantibacter hermannii]|uniref:FUSC family protein n=1 Tax=Atlantibacter hermannii TaxID=565 RepID=UPI001931D463|nr:FUSC family protein [Atlantibacter hermannii]MBL7635202.1 FUSC family protein [Atlantibacter hermannii]MBL7673880.1 FUSC family protein [Atlantibacter hermannii]